MVSSHGEFTGGVIGSMQSPTELRRIGNKWVLKAERTVSNSKKKTLAAKGRSKARVKRLKAQ